MSKSFKDKANYYKFHMEHNGQYAVIKPGKHKIPADEVPSDLKPMIDKLSYGFNSGLRHGNNRNMYAQAKVIDRRTKRAKEKIEMRKEVEEL